MDKVLTFFYELRPLCKRLSTSQKLISQPLTLLSPHSVGSHFRRNSDAPRSRGAFRAKKLPQNRQGGSIQSGPRSVSQAVIVAAPRGVSSGGSAQSNKTRKERKKRFQSHQHPHKARPPPIITHKIGAFGRIWGINWAEKSFVQITP